jgi:AcrR family transcriptional regulator
MSESQETHERVRRAALRLFATRGFEATGIRDIADEAGLSTASLYHYMGGKQDLLLEIIRAGMQALLDIGHKAVLEGATPSDQLAALVRGHVSVHGRMQLEALVSDTELRALSEPDRKGAVKLRDDYEAIWADVLERGVRRGEFQVGDLRMARLALLQMCTGVAYWYSASGPTPLPEIADQFADMALAMVRARGSRRERRTVPDALARSSNEDGV